MALYDKAVALDADFADAYAGYARAAAFLWVFSYDVLVAGAVPGGGQYFGALVIVGCFALVGWVAALLIRHRRRNPA